MTIREDVDGMGYNNIYDSSVVIGIYNFRVTNEKYNYQEVDATCDSCVYESCVVDVVYNLISVQDFQVFFFLCYFTIFNRALIFLWSFP